MSDRTTGKREKKRKDTKREEKKKKKLIDENATRYNQLNDRLRQEKGPFGQG